MNILAFAEVCKYATVKTYIECLASSFTKKPEEQKELYYTGWLEIVNQPGDYTVEAYCEFAYKAMSRKYRLYYMPEPKVGRYCADDAGVRRVKRRLKFYKKH